ncbi:hydroxymethylglutaryl-CoA reductase, degradative [Thermoplasmatales archaeon ex4572_165]|nr:MAG: hydroxymethylglutaryl-CoA reductase, degradative [Thermoplasmatales archaeon ex4572_165]RLF59905.1 MAG: hydroxymethylglutaryl-CoA reductase, degradative [Thermoplasmata archaeon]
MVANEKSSKISGFYKLSIEQRIEIVKKFSDISDEDISNLKKPIDLSLADTMIENVIGTFEIPIGIAMNFTINGEDKLIPMATEESSVVAAASNAAKIARIHGGFKTEISDPLMIGQIQILGVKDIPKAASAIIEKKQEILKVANAQDKILVGLGGGAKDIEVRILETSNQEMIVVHLIVDVRDAMGANAVNTMVEALAPIMEELTDGYIRLKILSNLADKRIAKAKAVFDKEQMGGEKNIDAFLESYSLASIDPYRAATHNKGIMNGIDAVIVATGNDFRAIEAGAHAYAARKGQYSSLTKYSKDESGNLVGEIELPVAVGIVGGAGSIHPKAKFCKKILNIQSAKQLSEIIASVGLAQNFAAVFALSTVGIQKGHMSLHARNIAMMAGANKDELDIVAEKMVKEGNVRMDRAKEILESMK